VAKRSCRGGNPAMGSESHGPNVGLPAPQGGPNVQGCVSRKETQARERWGASHQGQTL